MKGDPAPFPKEDMTGDLGLPGIPGEKGIDGDQGSQGEPGVSSSNYEVWRGEKGIKGERGDERKICRDKSCSRFRISTLSNLKFQRRLVIRVDPKNLSRSYSHSLSPLFFLCLYYFPHSLSPCFSRSISSVADRTTHDVHQASDQK